MKKGYIKLLCLMIFSIIMLILSNFVLDKINYTFLTIFIALISGIAYFLIGFEKERGESLRTIRFNVIVTTIFYLLFTYVLGIFTSFYHNVYNLTFIGIVKNILMVLPFVVISELFRYQVVSKSNKYKIVLVLITVFFVLLSISPSLKIAKFDNADSIITFVCITLLPIISKEIALTYLSYVSGYMTTIYYRILMDLYIYFIPILPNFGIYIDAVLRIAFPTSLIIMAYKIANKKKEKVNIKKDIRRQTFVYTLSICFLTVLVLLVSGLIKYQLLTIGSGSMDPVIKKGDAIIIEKYDNNEKKIEVEDIIAFKKNNMIIVHRVIDINENGIVFYTKGDNNNAQDGYPVELNEIVGIYKLRIPLVGFPTVWLSEVFKVGE